MLDIKEQNIQKVGKYYVGFVCQNCGKAITRKIYDYHLPVHGQDEARGTGLRPPGWHSPAPGY